VQERVGHGLYNGGVRVNAQNIVGKGMVCACMCVRIYVHIYVCVTRLVFGREVTEADIQLDECVYSTASSLARSKRSTADTRSP
jgi:hypothetical protein